METVSLGAGLKINVTGACCSGRCCRLIQFLFSSISPSFLSSFLSLSYKKNYLPRPLFSNDFLSTAVTNAKFKLNLYWLTDLNTKPCLLLWDYYETWLHAPQEYLTINLKLDYESVNDLKDLKGKMNIGLWRTLDTCRSSTKL